MVFDLSYLQLLTATLIAFCAATVQALVGIGFALLAVPLLALIDIAFVPGATLLASLLLVVLIAVDGRAHIDYSGLPSSLIGITLGSVVGGGALFLINPTYLPRIFGLVILAAVALSIVGLSLPNNANSRVWVGMVSGVMGTMSGIHGPPFALLYQHDKGEVVRPTLSFLFALSYTVAIATLVLLHQMDARVLSLALLLMPGVLLGFLTAKTVTARLDNGVLQVGILLIAGSSAMLLLVRA